MPSGPYLVAVTVGAIVLLLALILVVRLHAFLALLITSLALGLAAGMPAVKLLKSVQAGIGDALSFIAVVIGLGAMIGRFIEHSGGGRALADWLIEKFGRKRAPWAMLTAAFLVGLPVFFEVGFIILAPLAWNLARESKRSLLLYGMPLAAAMTITHSLVPPHPAPSVAVQLMGADLGRTILYGIALSIPLMIIGGMVYGGWIARRISPALPKIAELPPSTESTFPGRPPAVATVVFLLVLPVLLIFAATLADIFKSPGKPLYDFLGHPFTALLATLLVIMICFGFRRGMSRQQVTDLATDSLAPVATLLLIIGGGGAFKQVIVDCGVAPYAGKLLAATSISPLLVCFVTAAGLRAAQGSATVAIVTAAGILAPLMKQFSGYSPEILVLATCCGGSSLGHVNDAGFWLVKEYLGMTVGETLRSWTVMKVIASSCGIGLLLLAHAVLR
ncbi:MAG TPA: gluconate:H+ symporter [Bryobacteraceae bacterium]|nr:gluconate:H+ symporter [Bryobacteraceae bacterium]